MARNSLRVRVMPTAPKKAWGYVNSLRVRVIGGAKK